MLVTAIIGKRRSAASRILPVISGLLLALSAGLPAGAVTAEPPNAPPFPRYHAHRLLLLPRPGAAGKLKSFQQAEGQQVLRTFGSLRSLEVVALPIQAGVRESVARYRNSGLVRFAEPDYLVTAAALPDDPRFQDGTQWALNNYGQSGGLPNADIDAPEAWDVQTSARSVVVAVIDSGIRPTHEDLAANLWVNPSDGTHGFNAITGGHDSLDDNGHGTHIAGIIGAVGNNARGVSGVAWQTQLMPCKFLDSNGNGYTSDAIECIEFARSNHAQVINLSWGGPEFSESLSNALWFARADGILLATAAGNNAANLDLFPYYPACLDLDNLLAVGASTRDEALWSLSSYGQARVHLFAPGAAIFSTSFSGDSSYQSRSGTSMASAYVAGALALLRAVDTSASPQALCKGLLAAVDMAPAYTGKCTTGGRLNVRKALDRPAISISSAAGDRVELRVTGVPTHLYVLYGSTNLQDWTSIATNRLVNSQWLCEEPATACRTFFRVAPAE